MKVRKLQQRRGWAFGTAVVIVKPTLIAVTKREYIDGEKIPATGGCIVVANHISHADPFTLGLLLYDHGRIVRYLAKQEVFEIPVLSSIVRNAGQIPVQRLTVGAASAYEAAVQAVEAGECVMFYPEGTLTRDPDLWPMTGRTGAARVALRTGAPLIPIGQWGVQDLLPPYGKPHLWPRKTVRAKVGDPVDLSDLQGQPLTNAVLHEATERIMSAITGLVSDLRGIPAPAERYDPRAHGVRETGNPNPAARRSRHHRHDDGGAQ